MRGIIIAGVLACAACQRYVEVAAAPAVPNGEIRLSLADNATTESLGPVGSGVTQIEGNVLATTDSTINLAVKQLTRRTGYEESWQGESVFVPRRSVVRLERKQLSMGRTLATVGGFIVGSFFARGMINGGDGTSSGRRGTGGGN